MSISSYTLCCEQQTPIDHGKKETNSTALETNF